MRNTRSSSLRPLDLPLNVRVQAGGHCAASLAQRNRLASLATCGKLLAMGNKDRGNREKKKPKKAAPPKVYQPTVTTINKPTAPKT
jgi:hypothetical protein